MQRELRFFMSTILSRSSSVFDIVGRRIQHPLPSSPGNSLFQSEPDLECDLVMTDFSVFNMPASLDNFKPIHVPDGLAGLSNSRTYRVFDARFGRADEFDHFINMIFHEG